MSHDPYAPPTAVLVDGEPGHGADDERLRRAHIGHERQLRSVGRLYLFGGGLMVLVTLVMGVTLATAGSEELALSLWIMGIYAALAVAALVVGVGLVRLRPWVRVPGALMSALGLLAIPIGTLINGWILYLLFCERGRTVLAPDYARVIAATPHVRYVRSTGEWIALGVVLALVAALVVWLTTLR